MVSHDLLRLMVTNQIAFDRRHLRSTTNSNAQPTVVDRRWFPIWKPQIPLLLPN